jgi:hypothetical protein
LILISRDLFEVQAETPQSKAEGWPASARVDYSGREAYQARAERSVTAQRNGSPSGELLEQGSALRSLVDKILLSMDSARGEETPLISAGRRALALEAAARRASLSCQKARNEPDTRLAARILCEDLSAIDQIVRATLDLVSASQARPLQ